MSTSKASTKTSELKVVRASEEPSFVVGSLFNGSQIPTESTFDLYQHKRDSYRYVLHGENSTLEYNGDTGEVQDANDYVVALYDPKEKSVELYKAPLVRATVTSLEHRVHKGPKIQSRGVHAIQQRNALGEAFGTKKAKAAIADLRRNRIDTDKLQEIELDIIDNVADLTSDMPSRDQIESATAATRPTPAANEDARRVEDIYTLESIIPERELQSIRVESILDEVSAEARLQFMPYPKSEFVAKNLDKYVMTSDVTKMQMLYYASLLFGVYKHRWLNDKTKLMEALDNKAPEILIDGILERFAVEKRRGGFAKSKDRSFVIDPFHQDKMLCYLLALLLIIDDFSLHTVPVAHELNIKPTKIIGLFRALGAKVNNVSPVKARELGLTKKEIPAYKVAHLRVPFQLPPMTKSFMRA